MHDLTQIMDWQKIDETANLQDKWLWAISDEA